MIKTQLTTDKLAMTLSFICVIHCFFVPTFVIFTSSIMSFSVDNGFIHQLIVFIAVPVSIFAFSLGYKNHKTTSILQIGIFGLLMFIFAVVMGEKHLGELGEKTMTLFGSVLVAYSHLKNHRICRNLHCSCHEE